MNHLFIINPAAGKKESTRALEDLLGKLSFAHEVVYTQKAGDARDFARKAAESGEEVRIYACGGDGTLNEVVNGAAGYPNAAVTCVPKGTGNDFLKIFGENYRTLFYDLEGLAVGPEAQFDLMDCNGHLGIDVVCTGVDARIADDVHRYKDWRFVSGMGAYVLALLENVLFKGISTPMRVKTGAWEKEGMTTLMCVCNGRHYGGGFNPVPDAMPDDGILDVLHIKKISLPQVPFLIGRYAKGKYKELGKYVTEYHGDRVSFSSTEEMVTVVDGEVIRGREFTVRLSEKKLRFFYPAGAAYR